MSAIADTAKALGDNPDLRTKVMSASSPDDRAAILRDAGVSVPTQADVNSHVGSLADVSGAGATTTGIIIAIAAAG